MNLKCGTRGGARHAAGSRALWRLPLQRETLASRSTWNWQNHLKIIAVLITTLSAGWYASADTVLTVSDGVVSSGPITLPDGSGSYANFSFDNSWALVVASGQVLGNPSSPNVGLVIDATSLGSTNPLTITLSDNNLGPAFGNNDVLSQLIGQPVNGTGDVVTFNTYYDSNNNLGALTTPLTASGNVTPDGSNEYDSSVTNTLSLPGPYSLTEVVTIAGGQSTTYSLVANSQVTVPCTPPVATPLTNQTACVGGTAMFSTTVQGGSGPYPFPYSLQWYQGSTALDNQTNDTLILTNITDGDAGIYSVVVINDCGMEVTNSATLTINAETLVTMPPANSTNCPDTTAFFSVNVTGTDLMYQWYYQGTNPLTGQTGNILTLSNVCAANAGIYSVVTMGACSPSPQTNCALLVVLQYVSVAPLPNFTNLINSSVTFTAMASGTGPFTYQWFQGDNELIGQTNSTLTLSDLQLSNAGPYSVSVRGECGPAATATNLLTIHLPPVVSICYPTNGQTFVAPATFNIMAMASDPDGTVTNVQFLYSSNGVDSVFIGQTNNPPYLTIASNLAVGSYTLTAQAVDNFGAMATSEPVTVEVVPPQPPSVSVVGKMVLNFQDGYQWLSNVVCNPVESPSLAVRVYIQNITNSAIQVVNATGTNNGVPYIESPAAIQPGTCWTNVIMFYDPVQAAFYPTLSVELVQPPNAVGNPAGTVVPMLPPKMLANGTFLIEFASIPGGTYYVQYSSDMVNWNTSFPAITGTGQHMQWIDSGPPLTSSLPAANVTRFYRVILAQ